MGSVFASGFYFGVGVGGFEENDLFRCLQNSPTADGVFEKGNTELKKALLADDI